MLLRLISSSKKSRNNAANKKPERITPLFEFIPYAAFVDPDTILTKNGEVMQTLKIATNTQGIPNEAVEEGGEYLRVAIREAIAEHIPHEKFAFWIHTFRNKTPLSMNVAPTAPFAQKLHAAWQRKHGWKHTYYNECYVTIIRQGQSAELFDMNDVKKGYWPTKNREYRGAHLETIAAELKAVTDAIMARIARSFKVEKLTFKERQTEEGETAFYSEQLEWLHHLINLESEPMPVKETDLALQLYTHDITFGFNALETKTRHHKRFAAMLTIKHYHDLPPEAMDQLLQLPKEMIITQTGDYISAKEALEKHEDIRHTLEQSEDGYVAVMSGAVDMFSPEENNPTAYMRQQTVITMLCDTFAELDDSIARAQTVIAKLGLVSIREDIKMEEAFWSVLPGNFEFLRRQHAIPTKKIAGFARLNYYPIGALESVWGEPITILPTSTQTPYLFHFHEGNNGHTLFLDYNSFPDAMGHRILNFFLAEASRQVTRTIIFDRHLITRLFTQQMQGTYIQLGGEKNSARINLMQLANDPRNQGFLTAWLATLLDVPVDDEHIRTHLRGAVESAFNQEGEKTAHTLVAALSASDAELGKKLQQLVEQGALASILSQAEDTLDLSGAITGINIDESIFKSGQGPVLFAYLLHRLILTLDGQPTLIVLKEAWSLLDHSFFASRLESLLDMLKERNAAMIFAARDIENIAHSVITPDLVRLTSTHICVPDDIDTDYFSEITSLSENEVRMLGNMERQKGDFLLKHGKEIIPSQIVLDESELDVVLMGDAKMLYGMKTE